MSDLSRNAHQSGHSAHAAELPLPPMRHFKPAVTLSPPKRQARIDDQAPRKGTFRRSGRAQHNLLTAGGDGDQLSGLIRLAARLNCLAGSEEAGSAAATNAARRRWFESDTGGIRERLSLRSR
jgi:hypothetical protein